MVYNQAPSLPLRKNSAKKYENLLETAPNSFTLEDNEEAFVLTDDFDLALLLEATEPCLVLLSQLLYRYGNCRSLCQLDQQACLPPNNLDRSG